MGKGIGLTMEDLESLYDIIGGILGNSVASGLHNTAVRLVVSLTVQCGVAGAVWVAKKTMHGRFATRGRVLRNG